MIASTIAINPFSRNSDPTLAPTISTRLTSKLPVSLRSALTWSPISTPKAFELVFVRMTTSSSLPKKVTDAPSYDASASIASLTFWIGALPSYCTWISVPPAKSIPKLNPLVKINPKERISSVIERKPKRLLLLINERGFLYLKTSIIFLPLF